MKSLRFIDGALTLGWAAAFIWFVISGDSLSRVVQGGLILIAVLASLKLFLDES